MQVREIEFSSTILIISKRSKQWRIIQERFNAVNCQQGVPCSCSVSKISVEQLGICVMAIKGNAIQCLRLSCSFSLYVFAWFQCSTISLLIFDNIKIVLSGDWSSVWFLVGFVSIWGKRGDIHVAIFPSNWSWQQSLAVAMLKSRRSLIREIHIVEDFLPQYSLLVIVDYMVKDVMWSSYEFY